MTTLVRQPKNLVVMTVPQLYRVGRRCKDILQGIVLELARKGQSVREISEGLDVPKSTVHDWVAVRNRTQEQAELPPPPVGTYYTCVVDPPWPIEKIQRDVRPNQVAMDYPTMTLDDIAAMPIPEWAAPDAHLYLWTTHKHVPHALDIMDRWGFSYQCVLTWVKNVGITPFSWMYSTELAIFGRRGSLDLLQLGRRLDFSAPVREHSRKPDEFYDLVRDVSPGPRIDIFSREDRDGFDSWGLETGKFALEAGQGLVGSV